MTRFVALALLATVIGVAPLQAGDKVKFGGAVNLDIPTGNLKTETNDRLGGGLAFQVSFDLGGGHMLRPRLDVDYYSVKAYKRPDSNYREDIGIATAGLGADYLYYVNGQTQRGWYVLAGLSVQHWGVAFTTNDHDWDNHHSSSRVTHRRTSLGGAVGGGYQFTKWFGMETRYTLSQYEGTKGARVSDALPEQPTVNRSGNAVQIAATFRW